MKNNGLIDFHSHILPGMDDGSRNVQEALEMLRKSAAYGVDTVVATPHFYARRESPVQFLARREQALTALREAVDPDLPAIVPAAEVAFFSGISHEAAIDQLCIGSSNYLLLEMPFERWSRSVLREVLNLMQSHHITPILAHIERYLKLQKGTDRLEELLSYGALVQMNAEYVSGLFTSGKALRMIHCGDVHLLGSDCHNMQDRKPNLDTACRIISRKLGDNVLADMTALGRQILNQA